MQADLKLSLIHICYMTVSDGEAGPGEGSFSLDAETLENLLGMLCLLYTSRCV